MTATIDAKLKVDDFTQHTIDEFRANDGKVGGMFEGAPLLLLHTVGAKTGTERVSPLMYLAVGDDQAIFASKGGSDESPAWYHNLKADPDISIQIGTENVAVRAREAEGEEHARIWNAQVDIYPQFGEYLRKTSREIIPVVVLERI